jgi:hypothetical protein
MIARVCADCSVVFVRVLSIGAMLWSMTAASGPSDRGRDEWVIDRRGVVGVLEAEARNTDIDGEETGWIYG